jgi:hypothetical protein
MKITMQEFEEFEREFLFEKIKNPWYRLGQAFLNKFPEIEKRMEQNADLDKVAQANMIWNTNNRKEVLELLEGYIEE